MRMRYKGREGSTVGKAGLTILLETPIPTPSLRQAEGQHLPAGHTAAPLGLPAPVPSRTPPAAPLAPTWRPRAVRAPAAHGEPPPPPRQAAATGRAPPLGQGEAGTEPRPRRPPPLSMLRPRGASCAPWCKRPAVPAGVTGTEMTSWGRTYTAWVSRGHCALGLAKQAVQPQKGLSLSGQLSGALALKDGWAPGTVLRYS